MKRRRSKHIKIATLVVAVIGYLVIHFFPEKFEGRVVAVKDGDTIEVIQQGQTKRIRLSGVDAPEKDQPFGNQAKKFTSDLVFGTQVTVKVVTTDRYGRLVAEVLMQDGRNLNQELVRSGYAWWYREYSNDAVLALLEEEARLARRGLWTDKNPVPPWMHRREQREDSSSEVLIPSIFKVAWILEPLKINKAGVKPALIIFIFTGLMGVPESSA